MGAGLVVSLVYASQVVDHVHYLRTGEARHEFVKQSLADVVGRDRTRTGLILSALGRTTGLPAYAYLAGLAELARHNATGHTAYLLGRFSTFGWWYYFPVAFLVKTPTAILVAGLLALACLAIVRRPLRQGLLMCSLVVTPAIYFVLAMRSSVDIGVRHILPVYPFLYVVVAFVLVEHGPRLLGRSWFGALIALLGLLAVESVSAYPNYLPFFNWASGGSGNGARYLLDSNIDWGQDTKKLARYVQDHRLTPLCTALFGVGQLEDYGVQSRSIIETPLPLRVENLPCVAAVSVNFIQGLFVGPAWFEPLRKRQPMARIGYSIYVYDLRR
jgi:hypothetical protein